MDDLFSNIVENKNKMENNKEIPFVQINLISSRYGQLQQPKQQQCSICHNLEDLQAILAYQPQAHVQAYKHSAM